MKKFLVLIVFLAALGYCETIGVIDSQQVIQSYNKAITAQADLAQKQVEIQDYFLIKQKEYEAQITSTSTQEEILAVRQQLEKDIIPKKQELLDLNNVLSTEIESDIMAATKKVADQLRVDVVLDNKAVFVGGIDMTSLVIAKLNSELE